MNINFRKLLSLAFLALRASKSHDGSYAQEGESIALALDELQIKEGFILDIAAADGFTGSPTYKLFQTGKWSGLAIEMNKNKFSKLAYLYSEFKNVNLSLIKITPLNIVTCLKSFDISRNFELLNLDVDSYDLDILKTMLESQYFPKVISMEINEKIPSGIYFKVNFDENHFWKGDHFYGCSLDAATETLNKYGYVLKELRFNNAIFVSGEIVPKVMKVLKPDEAYISGYVNQINRKTLFPWNHDVDFWLDLNKNDAIEEIFKKFHDYDGLFTLRESTISKFHKDKL